MMSVYSIYSVYLSSDDYSAKAYSRYNQWLNENHRRFTTKELEDEQKNWHKDVFVTLENIIKAREKEELVKMWIEE